MVGEAEDLLVAEAHVEPCAWLDKWPVALGSGSPELDAMHAGASQHDQLQWE